MPTLRDHARAFHAADRARGVLTRAFPRDLVPPGLVLGAARLRRRENALLTPPRPVPLDDPRLASFFADRELGGWVLSAAAINRIARHLHQHRVQTVLELSSGVSTIVFCHLLRGTWPQGPKPAVVSLEQDASYLEQTRAELARFGADPDDAALLHAPVVEQLVEGTLEPAYEVDAAAVRAALGERAIDLVLVDGPAAGHGGRFATLPVVRPLLRRPAWFVLDDALRDSELDVARRWRSTPGIELVGYDVRGWGLLFGRVHPLVG